MRLFELIPKEKTQNEQLHILRDLQTLLSHHQLDGATLVDLHREMAEVSRDDPGSEAQSLSTLITFEASQFHFYSTLRQLLLWPLQDLQALVVVFPNFQMLHFLILSRITHLSGRDLSDIVALFLRTGPPQNQRFQPPTPVILVDEQPPARIVYKRNVKPPPVIIVEGHEAYNDGTLYVAPILIRCDNNEEVPKIIKGDDPVRVMATKSITFKSLKISQTSHQLDETLFIFKFELRKYGGTTYQVLNACTSNPFMVCSHSTQIKGRPKSLPSIQEVIPVCSIGGARVAILGTNFEDSPTARVKFNEIEVMPTFHGAKTLIVQTPKHEPGVVTVRICNEPNQWSTAEFKFTFLKAEPLAQQRPPAGVNEAERVFDPAAYNVDELFHFDEGMTGIEIQGV